MTNVLSNHQQRFDAIVIGAGIVGLGAAYELWRRGKRVAVIDRQAPMDGCSAGNAGYLADANIFPPATRQALLSVPSMLLDKDGPLVIDPPYLPSLVPWGIRLFRSMSSKRELEIHRSLATLTTRAIDSYGPMLKSVGASDMLERRGALVACLRPETVEQRARMIPVFEAHRIAAQRLGSGQVLELEPSLAPNISGGIFFPNAARCINPQRLGQVIARHLQSNGVTFVRDEILTMEALDSGAPTPGEAWNVVGSSSTYIAAQVALCAGYASRKLLATLDIDAPLASERGYHLMLPDAGITLRRPVVFAEPYFAATPMEHGLRLAGTVEFAKTDKPMTERRADMLLKLAQPYLPGIRGEHASRWMGVRPTTPDGVPYIGSITGRRGLFYAFGHGHGGLTLAAVSAKVLVDMMTDQPPSFDVSPYTLNRFDKRARRQHEVQSATKPQWRSGS
ncbi:amino acid dehydrogenase [Pandoraea terrae]|uniref:Amino acid dehydrogenase n=1 Tax=Pandoraea terrae TaxID=1537710 RepID=A0A5E4WXD6_9BURK|nr:FAD-binding oxidoreductase [Pandoraea terrae]VVE29191.1 amino acid dehydrogenase [Pandoraea terrae]